MDTVKIGNRGQITIPRRIRRQFGLHEGDSLALIPQGDQLIMRPITQTLFDLRGSIPVEGAQDFAAIRQQVIATRARKAAHGN